ncbi:helix-turn-helix domain-containing protein [Brachybacterium sp. SGAir0954]|uniref:helix-turn-helix domain-containing protein n=1 Tax=Brachybacterium sp. SGAir0954 TaxID=2571029 RepID=UPI00143DBC51|nr:helix-turn-helix domain-containing protein [Brachybacterium sp. SGAir0954]
MTDWLTPDDAAEELQLSPYTVRLLCRTKKLPGAQKFGQQWRIPRTAIEPRTPATPPLIAPRNRRSAAQQKRTA